MASTARDGAAGSPRIRVLPADLADQIAAGEVVERPASAVKELVDNALDAGARRIDIEVLGGGRELIRVVDDGCGMTREEARLALLRHATSKLRCLDDLFTLQTMGFRGEALPSIAAVSRLALTSRVSGEVAGFCVEVEGGIERDGREVAAPIGTQIAVRDLFWNVPARLKFLKAEATEAGQVTEMVSRLALAHPAVHFRLRHGGRLALDLPPHATPSERVKAVLGRRLTGLYEAMHEEAAVKVHLFLTPPEEAQATSRGVWPYVGKRFVRDRGLLHAVVMGYGELCPRGRYPTAVVLVTTAPGAVDINVHPQKVEVRFARPQDVYAAIRHGVARTVADAPWLERTPDPPAQVTGYANATIGPLPEPARLSDVAEAYGAYQARLFQQSSPIAMPPAPAVTIAAPHEPAPPNRPASFLGRLRYLGQLERTYLVCEAAGELVLVDQHAAHERVAFERLREARAESRPSSQQLLFPQVLELEPGQAAVATEHSATLASVGFQLEPLSGRSFALSAAPSELRDSQLRTALFQLLSELAEAEGSRGSSEWLDRILATVACHSVVRAGDSLTPDEALALLEQLDRVDFKAHCPHGRPVLLRMSVTEIGRRFGRT